MHRRMTCQSAALWLLLIGTVLSQGCCQHWSFGLNPGGKRELDNLSLDNLAEGLLHLETPCSAAGCADEFLKMYKVKGFLHRLIDQENGHRTYKK